MARRQRGPGTGGGGLERGSWTRKPSESFENVQKQTAEPAAPAGFPGQAGVGWGPVADPGPTSLVSAESSQAPRSSTSSGTPGLGTKCCSFTAAEERLGRTST